MCFAYIYNAIWINCSILCVPVRKHLDFSPHPQVFVKNILSTVKELLPLSLAAHKRGTDLC